MGIKNKLAMAAGAAGLLVTAACSSNNENPDRFCARDGDGQLVSTSDGKNFSPLSSSWKEGTEGWNRTPICAFPQGSAPPEGIMPMKELPRNAVVHVTLAPEF